VVWHRALDFSVAAVATDAEGDVYLTGFAPYGPPTGTGRRMEMVLARVGPDGDPVWTRTWRSASRRYPDARGLDVAVAPDASIVYVSGAIMLPPWEATQPLVSAYSGDGTLLWSRRTAPYGTALAAMDRSGAVGGGAAWLARWDPEGDRTWRRSFVEPDGEHCDVVEDVTIAWGGAVYAIGFLDRTPTCASLEGGAFEDADIVIQERSSEGDLRWSRVLVDDGVDNDWGMAIAAGGDALFVGGEMDGRAWLARLAGDGEVRWTARWGRAGEGATVADLSATPDGVVYALDPGTRVLRRYTSAGELVWERRLPRGRGVGSGIAADPDRALYVTTDVFAVRGDLWRMRP
jgi:outer membrane protein assembly factor BamB